MPGRGASGADAVAVPFHLKPEVTADICARAEVAYIRTYGRAYAPVINAALSVPPLFRVEMLKIVRDAGLIRGWQLTLG